jgi:DNA primase
MSEARDSIVHQLLGKRASARGWAKVRCPFCLLKTGKEDTGGALSVHLETGSFHCFRCKSRGRLSDEERQVMQADPRFLAKPGVTAQEPPREFMLLAEEPAYSAMRCREVRQYLKKRRIGEELWEAASIGVCLTGRYAERVVVPVFTPEGAWHGFVARSYGKHERGCDCFNCKRKYMNSKGMAAGDFFYNHNAMAVETDDPVLVVEGVFDALAYWPDAVAALGDIGYDQKASLAYAKRPVCFVPDGDKWEEGMWHALALRYEGQAAGFVKLPPRTDPDEVDKDWLLEAAHESIGAAIEL